MTATHNEQVQYEYNSTPIKSIIDFNQIYSTVALYRCYFLL